MGRKEERLEQIKKQAAEREKIEARLKAAKEKRITEGQNKSYVRAGGEAFPTFEELRNNRNREQADRFSEKNKEMISGIWKNPAMTTAEKQMAAAELNIKGTENYKRIARGEKKSLSSKIIHPGEAPEALEAVRTPDGDIKITSSPKDIHNAARYNIAAEDYNAAVERHNNEIKRQQEEERARRREYKRTYPYAGKSFDELTGMYNATRSEKEKAEINSWRIQAANQSEAYKMRADAEKEYERYNSEYDKYRGMSTAVGLSPDKIEEFEKKRDEFKSQADYYKGVMDQLDERIGDLASESAIQAYGSIAEESGDDGAYHQSVYFAERYDTETELPALKDPDEEYLYNAINTIGRYKYDAENEDYVYSAGEYEFGSDYDKYKFMTDDERLTYNKLHNAGETDYEKEYLGALDKELTKRLNEKEARDAYEFGEKHPFLAGAATVATDIVVSPVATADNIIDELVAGSVDVNDGTSRQIRKAQNYRAGGRQHMVDNHGEWAGVAYDAGLELTNIAVTIALTKGVGSGATALGAGARTANTASRIASYSTMFGRSASYTMISAADRGASDREIIALGTATGLLEIATEALPFERFMNPKVTRGFVGYLVEGLKQVPGNAVEEIIAEAGGMALDALIMGEKSESRLEMQRLILEEGLTAEEAAKVVALDNLQRLGSAGFMGGIVGFGAGTATSAAAGISYNSHLNSFANDMIQSRPGAVKKLITLSAEIKSPAAVKSAEQIQKNGVTAKNVGDMIDSVIGQMLAEKGSKANIIRSMYILEGQDADFITSKEASAVADSIIRFAAGKATKADVAVLEQSRSAAMVLDVLEANSDAKKAVASQMRNSEYGMQNDRSATSGAKYKYAGETKSGIKKYVTDFPADMDSGARKKVFEERIATIFNLGAVKLNTDTKKIQIMGDKFVSEKNLYGDKKSSDLEMDAKVNSLYDIAEILSESKFMGKEIEPSFKDAEVKPKNKAHKGVKYWYYFKNTIYMDDVLYDVFFDIRDKGKEQYQYSIRFVEKNRTTRSGHTADNNLRRKTNESSSTTRVSQNEGSVNTQSMQEGRIYSQGKEVIIPEKARIAKNIILDEESGAFRTKNGKGYKVIEMMAQDLRKKVKFVKGLTDEDENVLDGVITEKGIIINTEGKDPVKWAATHEFSHRMKQSAESAWAKYQQYVVKATKKDGTYNERFKLKAKAYKTTDEAYINEEIAADYIGELFDDVDSLADFIRESRSEAVGIRNFWYNILDRLGLHVEKRKAQALWSKAYKKAMQNIKDGKVGEYEGSPKFKINPTFEKAFDNWTNNLKRKSGITLKVGSTSEALMSIGVKEQTIYWDTTKINYTLKEHPDISIETLKSIPQLIEKPVLIMEERNKKANKEHGNNRIFMLGELYNENEIPVIAFLELEPKNRDGVYLNEIKIVSTHARLDHSDVENIKETQEFINRSHLLYVEPNKNRTNNWLARNRLQLPFLPTTYGPINKITYTDDFVNTYSMQDGGNNTQKKSVTGTRLSGAEDLDTEQADGGFIPPGAEPRRDVKVPKSVQKGTKVRQFPRTAAEAETLSDETAEGVLDNVEKGKFNYTPLSDKSAMKNAYATIDTMGVEWVEKKVSDAIGSHSLDKITVALAEVLMKRYSEEGQEDKVQQLIIDFAAEGTRMGQSIQAISMLKKLDKNYEISYIDKIVENLKEEIIERNNKKAIGKKYSADIKVSEELKQKLRDAKTGEEREAVREEIYTEIARQMPNTWVNKWNAWRYLAMLGNAITHVRNVVGNAFFMPMIGAKNIAAKVMEPIATKVSGGKMERSKTFIVPQRYRQFAKEDALIMKKELSGGGKYNPTDMIRDRQRVFSTKPLEWMRIKVGDALEWEDWLFLKKHYKTALSNYLAANKIDLDDMDEKTLDRARQMAIKEAQRNTYRDVSAFANALSRFSKKNAATSLLVEGLMPFKKTPVNVLKRGIEYSPAGLVKVLTADLVKVKNGDMTASEYIDRICCSLTGTGVVMLGMLMRSLGLVTGASDDDKEKEFDELTGIQNHSISIGEHNYTLDWLAPFSLPFFVGIEVQNIIEKGENISFRNGAEVLGNMTEPFFEMSMLQGLTGTVDIIKDVNSAETFGQIGWNITKNYANQAVPTLFGQIARTIDGTQRKSYDDKNADMPSNIQYFVQGIMKKFPGLSQELEPYIDEWGRKKDAGNLLTNALQNMLSPGYYSGVNVSPMEKELKRLYGKVGTEDGMKIFPTAAVKKFNLSDGTEKNLTAEEYTKMQTEQGQTAYRLLTDIVASEEYNAVDDFTKGRIVSKVHEVANACAKSAVAGEKRRPADKWVEEALALVEKGDYSEAESYIVGKAIEQTLDRKVQEIIDGHKEEQTETDNQENGAYRHIRVYEDMLSNVMTIEEYANHRAEAKKTAAMLDGKSNLRPRELEAYLESTGYSTEIKGALFEAIGNKGWKNRYLGGKVGENLKTKN